MAITTVDGVVAGMRPPETLFKTGATMEAVGQHHTFWYVAGRPGAASANAVGIQGRQCNPTNNTTGRIARVNPGSGNSYIARFGGTTALAGTLMLIDRLWENSGLSLTSTSLQPTTVAASNISVANPTTVTTAAHGQASGSTFYVTITGSNSTPSIDGTYLATYASSTTFTIPVNVTVQGTAGTVSFGIPARDRDGSYEGDNVMCAVEHSAAGGSGTPQITITYTNESGTGSKSGILAAANATPAAGTFEIIPLAAGDYGMRSIQGYTANATCTSGTCHLVMFRVIAIVDCSVPAAGRYIDAVTGGMARVYDDSVLQLLWLPSATTAVNFSGQYIETQG
jgi:hypothetical protein